MASSSGCRHSSPQHAPGPASRHTEAFGAGGHVQVGQSDVPMTGRPPLSSSVAHLARHSSPPASPPQPLPSRSKAPSFSWPEGARKAWPAFSAAAAR